MVEEVFWAEAHDEAQCIVNDRQWIRRRLLCLFLLSDNLIFHPSYIWRSDITRKIILRDFAPLFVPDFTSIILGDSSNIESYIFDRYAKLNYARKSGVSSSEWTNYNRNLGNIPKEAPHLDAIFTKADEYTGLISSKDRRFRELLFVDLDERFGFDEMSLRCVIAKAEKGSTDEYEAYNICTRLQRWVLESSFVSREAFIHELKNNHLLVAARSGKVKSRLLHIYLRSNVSSTVHVPFLQNIEHTFDPYDPKIFEIFFRSILGKKIFESLYYQLDTKQVSLIIGELKDDTDWFCSRNLYINSIDKLESIFNNNKYILPLYLRSIAYSEYQPILLSFYRRIRLTSVAAIFGAMSFDLLGSMLSVIGNVGGTAITIWELYSSIKPTMDALRATHRSSLTRKIDKLMTTKYVLPNTPIK